MLKVIIYDNREHNEACVVTLENKKLSFEGPKAEHFKRFLNEEEFVRYEDDKETRYSVKKDAIEFMVNLYWLLTGSTYAAGKAEFIRPKKTDK